MKVITKNSDLISFRTQQKLLAFVPTMGALHDGHLDLVQEGYKHASAVIVSIFVNPTQFAPHEDFDAYPRPIEKDIEKLEKIGAEALWLPSVSDIYPQGKKTDKHIEELSSMLEGEFRPHFFDGVATVVARLFNAVKPDVALFGEKDFQQLQVIRKMVLEYDIPVKIIGVETKRDAMGLALSSRNVYLSEKEYSIATNLPLVLKKLANREINEEEAIKALYQAGFDKVDYCTFCNAETLTKQGALDRVLCAAWIGRTRLIDNMKVCL